MPFSHALCFFPGLQRSIRVCCCHGNCHRLTRGSIDFISLAKAEVRWFGSSAHSLLNSGELMGKSKLAGHFIIRKQWPNREILRRCSEWIANIDLGQMTVLVSGPGIMFAIRWLIISVDFGAWIWVSLQMRASLWGPATLQNLEGIPRCFILSILTERSIIFHQRNIRKAVEWYNDARRPFWRYFQENDMLSLHPRR